MKKWLRFFGLSFFSDNIAKEGIKRGYTNFILAFVLSIVLMFCGVIAANILPFQTHYNNSSNFKTFVYSAFANEDNGKRINVTWKDGKAIAGIGDSELQSIQLVNTYTNKDDAETYKVNGYNLIIDTRSAGAYDDFEAYCVSNDGLNEEISYEEYLTLSAVAKRNFDFKIRYTTKELIFTDELTAKHESYLEGLSADQNKEIADSYKELKSKKNNIDKSAYAQAAYALYVRAYYPDLSEYESSSYVPLIRTNYINNYVNKESDFIIILDDLCFVSFKTDGGLSVAFYGYFSKIDKLLSTQGLDEAGAKSVVDSFLKDTFSAYSSVTVYIYLLNITWLLLFLLIIPIVIALAVYCILRVFGTEWCKRYGYCLKIVGSFMWFAALIAAFITFICGFFVTGSNLLMFGVAAFFIILVVRATVLLIKEKVTINKQRASFNSSTDSSVEAEN